MNSRLPSRTRTVSLTSGKGGVGKTTLTCNLAWALAQQGRRVLILDGDLGLANVDIFFGTKARGTLLEVLRGERGIDEVLTPIAPNIDLLSGGSGLVELNRLSLFERRSLVDAVFELEYRYDEMLIDTAPGISDNVLYLNSAADLRAIVLTPDPASLTDCYALIKVLNQEYKQNRFALICNQVRDENEGLQLYSKFSEVVSRFLSVGLDFWGAIPHDPQLRRAIQLQKLILKQDRTTPAAKAIEGIAQQIHKSREGRAVGPATPLFWEQVMGVA